MLDGATYAVGGDAGFDGMDFYAAGRGGVLGDVSADVVAAALVFFNPDVVEGAWEGSRAVMPRAAGGGAVRRLPGHLGGRAPGRRRGLGPAGRAGRARSSTTPRSVGPRCSPGGGRCPSRPTRRPPRCTSSTPCGSCAWPVTAPRSPPSASTSGRTVCHASPHMAGIFGWEGTEIGDDVPAMWDEAEALTNQATDHGLRRARRRRSRGVRGPLRRRDRRGPLTRRCSSSSSTDLAPCTGTTSLSPS